MRGIEASCLEQDASNQVPVPKEFLASRLSRTIRSSLSAPLPRDEAFRTALAEAAVRYPGMAIASELLEAHVASKLDPSKPMAEALAELNVADLAVACAASRGDPKGLSYFEEFGMRGTEASLKRRGVSVDIIDEAKQNVRERMLVRSEDQRPRIVDYNGRGPLKHWLRVAVIREGIYLAKREGKQEGVSFDFIALTAPDDDPELAYFKTRYRTEYKQAFEAAASQLTSRERALLRQQYLLGMNVDEIGVAYQVHRATAARWVQSARDSLFAKARLELASRLGVARPEIEGIVRMIESQLEVSLSRLLTSRSRGI